MVVREDARLMRGSSAVESLLSSGKVKEVVTNVLMKTHKQQSAQPNENIQY